MKLNNLKNALVGITSTLILTACGGDDLNSRPDIDGFTDVTGSPLVIGDLLQIDGEGLNNIDRVTLNNVEVPVIRDDEDSILIRIPTNIDISEEQIIRIENEVDDESLFDERALPEAIIRYGIVLSRRSGSNNRLIVSVFDSTTLEVISNYEIDGSALTPPYKISFANFGSLALLPSGSNRIHWIDLTRLDNNDNFDFDSFIVNNSDGLNGIAVAETTDSNNDPIETIAVIDGGNSPQLISFEVDDDEPPYNNTPFSEINRLDLGSSTELRALAIDGNNNLFCLSDGNDQLLTFAAGGSTAVSYSTPTIFSLANGSNLTDLVVNTEILGLAQQNDGQLSGFLNNNASLTGIAAQLDVDNDDIVALAQHPTRPSVFIAVNDSTQPIQTISLDASTIVTLDDIDVVNTPPNQTGNTDLILIPTVLSVEPVLGDYVFMGLEDDEGVIRIPVDSDGGIGTAEITPLDFQLDNGTAFNDVLGIALQP